MDSPRWRKRGKRVALTRIDEAAYSIVLKDAFPGIVFLGSRIMYGFADDRAMTEDWLRAHSFGSIHQVEDDPVYVVIPSCRWRPLPLVIDGHTYSVCGPHLSFIYYRGRWDWRTFHGAKLAYDPPTLEFGDIVTSYLTDEPEVKAFYDKALRLVRKVATNRTRSELPHIGHVYGEGTSPRWIGHDAFRWCSESPTRMIAGIARPTLDWAFPDEPWYRAVEGVDRGVQDPVVWPDNATWMRPPYK